MRIRKTYNGVVPNGKLLNSYSESQNDGYASAYINKLHTYSTTEQRIGTWIDGKPLYRKVITGTLLNATAGTNTSTDVAINVSNISTVFVDRAWIFLSKRGMGLPFIEGTNGYNTICYPTSDRAYIRVRSNDNQFNGSTINISVLYTKTTD